MDDRTRFAATATGYGLLALAHAALTWPAAAVLACFGGGALVAFAAEVVAARAGWLVHRTGPAVAGVPVPALLGWTGTVYLALRVALLVADGAAAVAVTAALATGFDALTDHRGVVDGLWAYTDDLPGPRPRGVPWWNYAGWVAISGGTAALTVAAL
ncbi:MAG: carotenoid biosynthesis protein [Halobacteriaceae archaeon]